MTPALYCSGKVVTGSNHGIASSQLSHHEQDIAYSGFYDSEKLKFIREDERQFYIKNIMMLRHGNSIGENENLTELGRNQSQKVAAFLLDLNLSDYFGFCSPLLRCIETANVITEITKINFQIDQNFNKITPEETIEDFKNRIKNTLDWLPAKSLIISHCDFIKTITYFLSEENPEDIPNCSITYFENNRTIWMAKYIY